MKNLKSILLRDKVDLAIFVLVIAATVQHFIVGQNLTPGFAIMILYVFGVMYRLWKYNMTIRKQDQDILKLNLQIQEQNKLLEEMVKHNTPKGSKHTFKKKIEELYKNQNLEK